ncbi:hypothetical protein DFH06DRAFT_1133536 [Mycena polygramma]|nr:hypothetical protein DFH06DRAFT_1133536 [Mycena polygramma]
MPGTEHFGVCGSRITTQAVSTYNLLLNANPNANPHHPNLRSTSRALPHSTTFSELDHRSTYFGVLDGRIVVFDWNNTLRPSLELSALNVGPNGNIGLTEHVRTRICFQNSTTGLHTSEFSLDWNSTTLPHSNMLPKLDHRPTCTLEFSTGGLSTLPHSNMYSKLDHRCTYFPVLVRLEQHNPSALECAVIAQPCTLEFSMAGLYSHATGTPLAVNAATSMVKIITRSHNSTRQYASTPDYAGSTCKRWPSFWFENPYSPNKAPEVVLHLVQDSYREHVDHFGVCGLDIATQAMRTANLGEYESVTPTFQWLLGLEQHFACHPSASKHHMLGKQPSHFEVLPLSSISGKAGEFSIENRVSNIVPHLNACADLKGRPGSFGYGSRTVFAATQTGTPVGTAGEFSMDGFNSDRTGTPLAVFLVRDGQHVHSTATDHCFPSTTPMPRSKQLIRADLPTHSNPTAAEKKKQAAATYYQKNAERLREKRRVQMAQKRAEVKAKRRRSDKPRTKKARVAQAPTEQPARGEASESDDSTEEPQEELGSTVNVVRALNEAEIEASETLATMWLTQPQEVQNSRHDPQSPKWDVETMEDEDEPTEEEGSDGEPEVGARASGPRRLGPAHPNTPPPPGWPFASTAICSDTFFIIWDEYTADVMNN